MSNYIKSEFYRVMHSAAVHRTAMILVAIPLLMNLILGWYNRITPDFRYGTTSFAYSNIVASPMIYCFTALIIVSILYESGNRNGNLRNTVAYGISRTAIFAGKCIVSLITSLIILAMVMTVFIGSAALLLRNEGPVGVNTLLTEIPAVSLVAVASLMLGILILELFDSITVGILLWSLIMVALPMAFYIGGFKYEAVMKIAMWFPSNFFRAGIQVNLSQCTVLWDTAAGMAKCLISGAAGIALVGTAGLLLLRKRDL